MPSDFRSAVGEIEAVYRDAPIGLCVLDRNLRYMIVNERMAEMNGLAVHEHIGRTVRAVLPGLADAAEPLLRKVIETGEPVLGVAVRGETPAHPGVQRVWQVNSVPIHDRNGNIAGVNISVEEASRTDRMRPAAGQSRLTERERLVLKMIVEGRSRSEIAEALAISPRTVDSHRSNLMRKIDVRSPQELALQALRIGLLTQ